MKIISDTLVFSGIRRGSIPDGRGDSVETSIYAFIIPESVNRNAIVPERATEEEDADDSYTSILHIAFAPDGHPVVLVADTGGYDSAFARLDIINEAVSYARQQHGESEREDPQPRHTGLIAEAAQLERAPLPSAGSGKVDAVKRLRTQTNAGLGEICRAYDETGSYEKALELLHSKGFTLPPTKS